MDNKFVVFLALIVAAVYVISPIDLIPACPIDDVVAIIASIAVAVNANRVEE